MKAKDDKKDEQKPSQHDPSRRRFLKGVGVAGAGAALADHLLTTEAQAEVVEQATSPQPVAGSMNVVLDVNGQKRNVSVEPRTTLLSVLRNYLEPGLTGPKLVCDMGTCGACTVLMNDKPVYSCLVLAVDAVGKKLTTVEGLGTPETMNSVQQAFVQKDALMCGFCTPGFITMISAYLKTNPNPTMDQVREACKGNFCRCGTYPRIFEAALAAAKGGVTKTT
jgi:xanthine dehydrogenase YagT iron-sulfur-binding subunit